jgi:hypothetical protein
MATKSKAPKRQKVAGSAQKVVVGEQQVSDESDSPTGTGSASDEKSAPAIRKGVYLSALVYVEGEQAAPEDFAATATAALKDALSDPLKTNPDGLNITLKKVEVQNDVEQEETDGGKGVGEEKFQF